MKCKKCGSELFMYDDDVFECRNGGREWHGWVLDPEMVALMDGKDAFEQYAASLQQERERYRELASAAESLLSEFSYVDHPDSALNQDYYKKPYILHQILESHKEK